MFPKLLIIADDLTGALEAGGQLSELNIPALILNHFPFNCKERSLKKYEVIIVNTESRHLSEVSSKRKIRSLVRQAISIGIRFFYKKTDSTLRGNIGVELETLMKSAGKTFIPFIPAHPEQKRFTIKGFQYLGEKPVHKTRFGDDPLEPVTSSYIPYVLGKQTKLNIVLFSTEGVAKQNVIKLKEGITIFNGRSLKDLRNISKYLSSIRDLTVLAGTAGFVRFLPELFPLKRQINKNIKMKGRVLVINGSLNQISRNQVAYGHQKGIDTISISNELGKLTGTNEDITVLTFSKTILSGIADKIHVMITSSPLTTSENVRIAGKDLKSRNKFKSVSLVMGKIIRRILIAQDFKILMVIGGDTITGIMKSLQIDHIVPAGKLISGVAVSIISFQNKKLILITKPGGYGERDNIVEILKMIN